MQLQCNCGQPSECGRANQAVGPLEVFRTHSKGHILDETSILEQSLETKQSSTAANNMLIVMC